MKPLHTYVLIFICISCFNYKLPDVYPPEAPLFGGTWAGFQNTTDTLKAKTCQLNKKRMKR